MKSPELNTYWVVIRVDFAESLPVQGAEAHGIPPSAIGYYQKFGVTQASEEEVRRLVAGQILPVGVLDWEESVVSILDVTRLDLNVLARSGDWTIPGVWYKSGRIFVAPGA
jgi:hypothetical protein